MLSDRKELIPEQNPKTGESIQFNIGRNSVYCASLGSSAFIFRLRCTSVSRLSSFSAVLCFLILTLSCGDSATKSLMPAFSNTNLQGNYTYRIGGIFFTSTNGTQSYSEAGTFVADGNGKITAGTDDFVESSTLSSSQFTGTYTVATDGTGIITVSLSRGTVQFAISLISSSSLYLIEYDSLASGDGVALQQDPGAIPTTPAGTFVFHLHSSLPSSAALGAVSSVGQMTIQNGSVTGDEDVVRDGVPGSYTFTGSINSPDSNGRGTASLTDNSGIESDYIYYVVSSTTLKFLETDPGPLGGGRADAQTTSTSFSNASLSNGFAFRGRGDTLANSFGANAAGAFATDGNGNIVSGTYDSVVDGVPASNVALTGTYNVASNGRATITLTPQGMSPISLIAWMVSSSEAFFLVNSSDLAEDGRLDQQQSGSFSAGSLKGQYAFYMFGSETQGSPWLTRVGTISFDGNSTVTFNDYYVNHSGSTAQHGLIAGNYAVSANGRVAAFCVGAVDTQVLYLVSDHSATTMLGVSGSELAGSLGTSTDAIED